MFSERLISLGHKKLICIFFILIILFSFAGCKEKTNPPLTEQVHKVTAVGSQWYGHIPVWVGMENDIKKMARDMNKLSAGKEIEQRA